MVGLHSLETYRAARASMHTSPALAHKRRLAGACRLLGSRPCRMHHHWTGQPGWRASKGPGSRGVGWRASWAGRSGGRQASGALTQILGILNYVDGRGQVGHA